jgi:hypothetical protein
MFWALKSMLHFQYFVQQYLNNSRRSLVHNIWAGRKTLGESDDLLEALLTNEETILEILQDESKHM